MNIRVMLKKGHRVPQPSTEKEWKYGLMVGTVTMGDGVGYAVVQTEHNEFETVSFHSLLAAE